jgi:hypothetical protein
MGCSGWFGKCRTRNVALQQTQGSHTGQAANGPQAAYQHAVPRSRVTATMIDALGHRSSSFHRTTGHARRMIGVPE